MLKSADAALHAVNNAAEKSRKDFGEISSCRLEMMLFIGT